MNFLLKNPSKWEALSEELSKLCEVVFIISSSFIKDETLIQKSVDVIMVSFVKLIIAYFFIMTFLFQ